LAAIANGPDLSELVGSFHMISAFSLHVGMELAILFLGFSAMAPISVSHDNSPYTAWWRVLTRELRGISGYSLRFGGDGISGVLCASSVQRLCFCSFFFYQVFHGWALALGRASGIRSVAYQLGLESNHLCVFGEHGGQTALRSEQ